MTLRFVFPRCCVAALLALSALPARAQDERDSAAVDAAVENGLAFLARGQKRDGGFGEGEKRVAITALGVLGFLAAGHPPDVGKHGLTVRSAVDYLVAQVPADGYVGKIDGSRMYGQGIITLALAEACGVEPDPVRKRKISATLERLIRIILEAQKVQKSEQFAGGWRYEPSSGDSDLSLSGWSALALRAAQNVGINIPREPIDRAVAYVIACCVKDAGGFTYQQGQEAKTSMTSVAILNLYLLDASNRPEIRPAAKWLREHPVRPDMQYLYYATYYSTQAAWQLGEETWQTTWKKNRALLLGRQQEDGGWSQSPSGEEPGRAYATSMSVMTLSVPYGFLPIYQK